MKIGIFGYGKMGKEIEKTALQRGHKIIFKINEGEKYDLSQVEIAIDFSLPNTALENIITCFENNIPIISGTTGWLKDYKQAIDACKKNNGSFIYASNFSIGVNIFFELNKQLSKMMNSLEEYSVNIEEIHHTKKLDSPSGTAISIAEGIIENSSKVDWKLTNKNHATDPKLIPIEAKRIKNIPGTHLVSYKSEVDSIEIKHTAENRKGFALGAIIAAEWLINKNGVYTMKDVLNIG